MKRTMMSIIAVIFPWLALLIYDNPGGAVVALIMQATAIGWIPAGIWAWRVVHAGEKKTTNPQDEPQP